MAFRPTWENEPIVSSVDPAKNTANTHAKYLSAHDLQKRPVMDPILELLPLDARDMYLSIGREVRQGLVDGLGRTLRWQKTDRNINPEFVENDLDHTTGLLAWANEIEREYPDLYQEICQGLRQNWLDFLAMLTVHDIGEIGLGDVPAPLQGTEEGKRRRKLEPRWARYALAKCLADPCTPDDISPLARKMIALYDRFEVPRDDDRLALAAKILDKAQAAGHVARDIIPYNPEKPERMRWEYQSSQSATLEFADKLEALFSSPRAREQLHSFIHHNVLEDFEALEWPEVGDLRRDLRGRFPAIFGPDVTADNDQD